MTDRELLALVEEHLSQSGETAWGFGQRVAGDGNLVRDLRDGRSPTLRLAARILAKMREKAQLKGNG